MAVLVSFLLRPFTVLARRHQDFNGYHSAVALAVPVLVVWAQWGGSLYWRGLLLWILWGIITAFFSACVTFVAAMVTPTTVYRGAFHVMAVSHVFYGGFELIRHWQPYLGVGVAVVLMCMIVGLIVCVQMAGIQHVFGVSKSKAILIWIAPTIGVGALLLCVGALLVTSLFV